MSTIIVHNEFIQDTESAAKLCPFGAIKTTAEGVLIDSSCRMCLLCVKKGPKGAFELLQDDEPQKKINKSEYDGILVSVECHQGHIHPVSIELIGKARELASISNQKVFACAAGATITSLIPELLAYGVDTVCVYDDPEFTYFRVEPHTAALEDAIGYLTPSVVLVGGTPIGRTLAPRTAARLRTGLTADCTSLDIQPNTDLDQIRPAFGGNIMAHIRTMNHRPQFATVRYKIFDMAQKVDHPSGTIIYRSLDKRALESRIEVLDVQPKGVGTYIEEAEVIVAVGKGIQNDTNLGLFNELADLLGGQVACSRPLVENGWVESRRQIGLSGRTVRPKLIITCGISGSVQFAAGMRGSQKIIAINIDEHAPIMKIAHVGIVADVFEIVPRLIKQIRQHKPLGDIA
ncbi:MAG: electron transfer flavoprotein subunit alpha [Sphaerochaetaceae bacterium]|nr:electron transfer flavoprotein subunit alpha [Sphaerochaetaceae bacterium]MDD5077335.1 electron transfer flavoprotein subunit alpha [Sphaerochaetaceae bacterium]